MGVESEEEKGKTRTQRTQRKKKATEREGDWWLAGIS
jgi:hypothetical protein